MSAQHRWWLFSYNKPPIPIPVFATSPLLAGTYQPPHEYVMPYAYDMENGGWWRWADLAGKWIAEPFWPGQAPCNKNAVELLLLKE